MAAYSSIILKLKNMLLTC